MLLLPLTRAHGAVLADPADPLAIGGGGDRPMTSRETAYRPFAMPSTSAPGVRRS
jgi:hypothetical protein